MLRNNPEQIRTIKFRDGDKGDFVVEKRKKRPTSDIDVHYSAAMRIVQEIEKNAGNGTMAYASSVPEDFSSPDVDSVDFRKTVLIIVEQFINRFRTDVQAFFQEADDNQVGVLKIYPKGANN